MSDSASTPVFLSYASQDELQPYFDEDWSRSIQAIDAALVCLAVGDVPAARARLGAFPAEWRARIELEPDRALLWSELASLLRMPSDTNVHELKSGPYFVSLRGHPKFEALLNDPKNNAPLF